MIGRTVRAMQFYHLSRKAAVLIIGVVLAKVGYDLEAIGLYESLMYLAMLFSFFWLESLFKAYLSVYETLNDEKKKSSVFSIYIFIWIVSLVLGVLLWTIQNWVFENLLGSAQLPRFNDFLIYLIVLQPALLTAFVLQLNGRNSAIYFFGSLQFLGFLLAVVLPTILGYGMEGIVSGLMVFSILLHVVALILLIGDWKPELDPGFLKGVVWVLLPLMAYSLIQSFAGVFDAWLVNDFYQDTGSFAIFRFGARELPIVVPLTIGLTNMALPLLTKNKDSGLSLLQKEGRKLIMILIPIGMVLMILSEYLFEWVYNENFIQSAYIFNTYLLLILPQLLFPQTIFMSERKNVTLIVVGAFEVILNVILSLLWVGEWGMMGIAMATVVAFCFEKIILVILAYRRFGIVPIRYIPVPVYMLGSIMLLATFVYLHFDKF